MEHIKFFLVGDRRRFELAQPFAVSSAGTERIGARTVFFFQLDGVDVRFYVEEGPSAALSQTLVLAALQSNLKVSCGGNVVIEERTPSEADVCLAMALASSQGNGGGIILEKKREGTLNVESLKISR
jgi:hypothetical protein